LLITASTDEHEPSSILSIGRVIQTPITHGNLLIKCTRRP
jgi:hypothetical protein